MIEQLLPDLILMEEYDHNWERYLTAIYSIFESDFVDSKPIFQGRRLGLKRFPEHQGKSATFWHMTSTGNIEEDRIPDFRRCERIGWPKPIIENDTCTQLKVWAEPKGKNRRIHIWYEDEGYLVVLDDRIDYILPWTAFYVEREHEKRKYLKRWNKYKGTDS